jgi:hypothetical protein
MIDKFTQIMIWGIEDEATRANIVTVFDEMVEIWSNKTNDCLWDSYHKEDARSLGRIAILKCLWMNNALTLDQAVREAIAIMEPTALYDVQ